MAVQMRPVSSAILIPTRGRWGLFRKTLERQPFLNDQHTFVGVEHDEYTKEKYRWLMDTRCTLVLYNNKEGSVGVAREALRKAAVRVGYEYYVATDDNARFTDAALNALIQAAAAWHTHKGGPVFMAGMHSTAMHFDRNLITKKQTVGGWTSYPGIGFIFHCMTHEWYARYAYPPGCFALEDRHMMLSAIAAGYTEFRVCMDAPFSKSRYQHGGQGDIPKRRWNCGRSIEQLAHDFPEMVGARGTFPLPWQFLLQLRDGAQVDRLLGGAMRKGEALVRKKTGGIRARIRQS